MLLLCGVGTGIAKQQWFVVIVLLAAVVGVYFFARVKKVYYLLRWIARSLLGRVTINHEEIEALGSSEFLELPDERILSYYQLGDMSGHPVFYFHGTPSSALEAMLILNEKYIDKRLRIIAINRPGIGSSTAKPGRNIGHFTADVVALANHLQIPTFSVLGYSGGGPYVLACAASIAERLLSAVIVGGAYMINDTATQGNMKRSARLFWKIADRFPIFIPFFLTLMRTAAPPVQPGNNEEAADAAVSETFGISETPNVEKEEILIVASTKETPGLIEEQSADRSNALEKPLLADEITVPSDPDRAIIDKLDLTKLMRLILNVAIMKPTDAAVDVQLTLKGIDQILHTIQLEISMFHGAADRNVPIEKARLLSGALPNATLYEYEHEGHLSILINQFEAIAAALTKKTICNSKTVAAEEN